MKIGPNSIRRILKICSCGFAGAALAAAGPAPLVDRELPVPPDVGAGFTPVIDEARSHDGVTTWDLGPAPNEPGKHRYAVAIPAGGPAPEVTMPGRLGEAPVVIRLHDGRRIEWAWKLSAPLPTREFAPSTADAAAGPQAAPAADALPPRAAGLLQFTREKNGTRFNLVPGERLLVTTLTVPEGMGVEWAPADGGGRLLLLSRGYPVANLALALGGYGAELRPGRRAGEYEFILTAEKSMIVSMQAAGGGPGIEGYVNPGANDRGQMARNNSGNPASGGAFPGASYVGSNNNSANVWWMRSYLQWPLSAIPQNSTIQNAYLWPLRIVRKYGAATTNLYIRDLQYTTARPFSAYSAAAFDDLYAARPGHDPYLDTTVAGADGALNLTINSLLGHQASEDLNASVRGTGSSAFAIGFSSDAVTTLPYTQYLDLDPASVLWVYYNDYSHNQVVITGLNPFGNNGQPRSVRLYNYGEDMNITNWRISTVNYLGTTQSFTIPEYNPGVPRILGRHQSLDIFDTPDPSWNGSGRMITNANVFTWSSGAPGGDPLQVSLIRSVGGTADYACFAGAAPAAGAYWNGSCPGFPAGFTMYVRSRDSDTDSGADWSTIPYLTGSSLFVGELGARRRSDVVINGVLAYGGGLRENELSLLNYGPPINLQNWSLQFYDAAGTYHSFTLTNSTPVNTGERVWLVETNLFGTAGGYPPADARHINMNFATGLGWDLNPHGGEVMLFDAGGKPRDYLIFGDRRPSLPYAYDYLNWIGGNVLVPYVQPFVYRTGDLSTISAGDWTAAQWSCAANCSQWFNEPGWSPGQRVINRVQDELGIQQPGGNGGYAGAHGYGSRFLVNQMVGLERIAMPAEIQMEQGANNVRFVVKKQGSATVYYDSGPFSAPEPGVQVVTSPLISPPLVLDYGLYYDVMLYANGAWSHFSGPSSVYETLSFADWFTSNGMAGEGGFTPTATMNAAINPSYPIHQWLDVIHPPVITNPTANDGTRPPTYLLPDGELTVAYSFAHASSGGYGTARTWTVSAGTLPPGLTMSVAGVISGTPTLDGTYVFTVRVTDGAGLYREQAERLIVRPLLLVATSSLPYYDNASAPYNFQLQAFGGVTPLAWTCSGLPAGLSCSGAGVISGTVTAAVANGLFYVTVAVTDANGLTANRVLKLTVYRTPAILTPALANGFVGYDYGVQRLVAAGGTGAPNWAVTAGALPPGLALAAATGLITGTPTVVGSYSFTITFSNGGGSDSRAYTIRVDQPTVPNYWIRRGLSGADLGQLYYSPAFAQDNTVIAVTKSSILLVSQDGGYFWRRLPLKLTPRYGQSGATAVPPLRTVAFHPAFDGRPGVGNKTLIVNTAERYPEVQRSDDLGATWTRVISVNPTNFYCDDGPYFAPSGQLYCAGRANELPYTASLYRSDAALTSWTALDATPIAEFYPSPAFAADQTFFARGMNGRLYRSTNAGGHWTDFGLLASQAGRLEFSPNFSADHAVGYISSPGGGANNYISISLDNGYSFNAVAQAFNPVEFHFPPTYDAAANPQLFAAGGLGSATAQMMVSRDNGVNFSPTGAGGMASVNFSGIFRVSPTFATDQTLLALGANGHALFRSQDGGTTWGPSENGLYLQSINTLQLAPDYAASKTGFLGTDGGPYYTTNGGKVWRAAQLTGLPAVMQVRTISVSPAFATDRTVFAQACAPGAQSCQLIRSTDGGKTYAGLAALPSRDTLSYDLRVSPNFATDRVLLFNARWGFTNGGKTSAFYRSADAGASFAPVYSFYYPGVYGFDLSPAFANDQTSYLFVNSNGSGGAMISTDGGVNWGAAPGAWPAYSRNSGPRLSPNFNRLSGTDGTPSHTLLLDGNKSTNAGTTFAGMHLTMGGTTIFSPNYPTDNTLFNHYNGTVTTVGLYKSIDGGASSNLITPAADANAFVDVNQIALSPAYNNGGADRTVFVATGSGLWTSTDGGANWTLSTGTESFSSQVTAAAQDPNRAGRLYLGSLDDGIAYSNDDGETTTDLTLNLKSSGTPFAIRSILALDNVSTAGTGDTVLLVSTSNGLYRMSTDLAGNPAASWTWFISGSTLRRLSMDSTYCYVANAGTYSYRAPIAGGCASWSAVVLNSEEIGFSALSGPTVPLTGPAPKGGGRAPSVVAGSADAYWSANSASGAFHSADGASWLAAAGGNDYALPATAGYTSASPMGVNNGQREVAVGHSTLGVFLSRDGGDTWRNVSGPGSGLETTTKNASTFLTAATAYATTDLLVGINGSSNGGVYLSGDGGQHWTQVNQGFDPNNLAISSLVRTSCGGCPVQYYSGTYGSGMYTRTITVSKPPFYDLAATWCTGAGCACGAGSLSGPVQGGTSLKLCGSNFQGGMVVEFDGVAATGCVLNLSTSPQTVVCNTPPHAAGAAVIRVRNPDTRAKQLAQTFLFGGGPSRAAESLRVAKSGGDAWVSWSCSPPSSCTIPAPARLYRSQNALFSLYLETYNGGPSGTITGGCTPAAGNDSCYANAGVAANPRSYFWSVE